MVVDFLVYRQIRPQLVGARTVDLLSDQDVVAQGHGLELEPPFLVGLFELPGPARGVESDDGEGRRGDTVREQDLTTDPAVLL